MSGQSSNLIDELQGRLPPNLKWVFASIGGASGLVYAAQHGRSLATSCIVAGAALGFGFVVILFGGLRLVRFAMLGALVLGVINYVVLVPLGFGDHAKVWMDVAEHVIVTVLGGARQVVERWQQGVQ